MAKSQQKNKKRTMSESVRKNAITLIVFAVLIIGSLVAATPLGQRITLGLDLQGGVSVVMTASKPGNEAIAQEEMQTATSIVEARVNSLGASEASVQQQGDNAILVQIPGATDAQQAIETIGRTGLLEFVDVLDITDQAAQGQVMMGQPGVELQEGSYSAFMTGASISRVTIGPESEGSPNFAVNLALNSEGTDAFAKKSSELAPIKGQIAIVLDGVVDSAPVVQSTIPNGQVSITGGYSLEEAQQLKTVLDSGSLPVTLSFSDSRVVGPTLGAESLQQGLVAIVIGLAVVALYLLVFYRGLGLLTAASLFVFAIIYMGILALLSRAGVFAMSLPGIAGIVLTIGMAADSSILVLERLKEEVREGRSIRAASVSAVKHGIGTALDADAVTLVSALALFLIAIGPVKGFGLTLALGIICDLVVLFMFKGPLIRLLGRRNMQKYAGFWGLKGDVALGKEAKVKAGVAHA